MTETESTAEEIGRLKLVVEALRLRLDAARLERDLHEATLPVPPSVVDARNALQLAKLRKETSDLTPVPLTKWWHSWGSVAGITGVLTAIIPLTTGVLGYFGNQRAQTLERIKNDHELALKKQQQEHQIQIERTKQLDEIGRGYLSLAKDPMERGRVLRFAQKTAPVPEVRSWASDELKIVQEEIGEIRQKYAPHRCLRWDFEFVQGEIPESKARAHCAARGDKIMARMGAIQGTYHKRGANGEWVEADRTTLNVASCKCAESRLEEPKSQQDSPAP